MGADVGLGRHALTTRRAAAADSVSMTLKQQSAAIAASVLAALRIAAERGALTPENFPDIARAAGNNAAMQLQETDDEQRAAD